MVIAQTTAGTLIFGEVLKWKTGIGSDESKLTILTLSDAKTRSNYKVLCWNMDLNYQIKQESYKRETESPFSQILILATHLSVLPAE